MARSSKYTKGFRAGVAAAIAEIKDMARLHNRNGHATNGQMAEWFAAAAHIERKEFDTTEPSASPDPIIAVLESDSPD